MNSQAMLGGGALPLGLSSLYGHPYLLSTHLPFLTPCTEPCHLAAGHHLGSADVLSCDSPWGSLPPAPTGTHMPLTPKHPPTHTHHTHTQHTLPHFLRCNPHNLHPPPNTHDPTIPPTHIPHTYTIPHPPPPAPPPPPPHSAGDWEEVPEGGTEVGGKILFYPGHYFP